MSVTYYVALPFTRTDDGAPRRVLHKNAQAKAPRFGGPRECRVIRSTWGRSHLSVPVIRMPEFSDAVVLKRFGDVPKDSSEL